MLALDVPISAILFVSSFTKPHSPTYRPYSMVKYRLSAVVAVSSLFTHAIAAPQIARSSPTETCTVSDPVPAPTESAPSFVDYSPFTQSTFLAFKAGSTSFGKGGPRIQFQFADGPILSGQMDTGSVGMVISASNVPDYEQRKGTGIPGTIFYSSSYNLEIGEYFNETVYFPAAKATARVPVLAVTETCKCPGYTKEKMGNKCDPGVEKNKKLMPKGISMVGVGFSRGVLNLTAPATHSNPLTNIREIDGKPIDTEIFNNGYVLTYEGIHLGLTKENTEGFNEENTMKLLINDKRDGDSHWKQPPTSFKINNGSWIKGELLIDTGLSDFLTFAPADYDATYELVPDANNNPKLKKGTPVEIAIGESVENPIVHYDFLVGDDYEFSPTAVNVTTNPSRTTMNTGRRLLKGWDYFYDARNGYYGLRKPISSN